MLEGTDRLYRTTDKRFQLVKCSGCGLIRLHPQPPPDELGAYYPERYWYDPDAGAADRLGEAYRRLVLRDHIRFVRNALESSPVTGLVLDVGCGGGLFLHLLAEHGYAVAGFDNSQDAARVAWRTNGVPVVRCNLPDAPLREASCAAVTMFHVLEHLHDPAAYLTAAFRLIKPGGRLVVQVPNAESWQFVLLKERWNGADIPRHLVHFRRSDLVNLLQLCGYEVLKEKQFSLRDNPAGLVTSLAPGLDPMARRLRQTGGSTQAKLIKDAFYFGLVVLALPLAVLEAACGAGSTIMIEARRP